METPGVSEEHLRSPSLQSININHRLILVSVRELLLEGARSLWGARDVSLFLIIIMNMHRDARLALCVIEIGALLMR